MCFEGKRCCPCGKHFAAIITYIYAFLNANPYITIVFKTMLKRFQVPYAPCRERHIYMCFPNKAITHVSKLSTKPLILL